MRAALQPPPPPAVIVSMPPHDEMTGGPGLRRASVMSWQCSMGGQLPVNDGARQPASQRKRPLDHAWRTG
jgi:hypothetical protein